jgi:hypothetical protein
MILRILNTEYSTVSEGNLSAHGGNARVDSTLYLEEPARTDIETFVKLYGVHPGIISLTGKSIYIHSKPVTLI